MSLQDLIAEGRELLEGGVPKLSKWLPSKGGSFSHKTKHGTYHATPASKQDQHIGHLLTFARHRIPFEVAQGLFPREKDLGLYAEPGDAASFAAQHHASLSSRSKKRDGRGGDED